VTETAAGGDALIGQTLRAYRIQEQVGVSRWGKVYRGFQSSMNRTAAVRVLSAELAAQPGKTEEFLEESGADSRLIHPHLVIVYEAGQVEGTYFCAMEYMDGPPLREFLRAGDEVNEHHLLQTIVGVARALHFLWRRKVPHQPPIEKNVLTATDGTVKLINIHPLEAPASQSPHEDMVKLGVLVATLSNDIAPVSKPVSRFVERILDTEGREPFASLAEVADTAEALDQKLFESGDSTESTSESRVSRITTPLIALAIGFLVLVLIAVVAWLTRQTFSH
jgi:serine/threonine protein kinase